MTPEPDSGTAPVELWHHGAVEHDAIGTRSFGFWLYLLSDAMIFASLFAAWGVYLHATAGGPDLARVARLGPALAATAVLFASVLLYGLAMSALKWGLRGWLLAALAGAFLLGALFLGMEIGEFGALARAGALPERSAFLSDFWTIILAHGVHIFFGLLWMLVMMVQVATRGFSEQVVYRLLNLRSFWHFQALVWVCIFTFIYLRGGIA